MLDLKSNGGRLSTKFMGTFPGFGEVWYDPNAITNIVSQDLVEKAGFEVVYDKDKKEHTVTRKKGSLTFHRSPEGLTYLDMEPKKACSANMAQTVEGNKMGFTKRDTIKAGLAKDLYEMIGFPSVDDFKIIVQSNGIRN